MSWASALKKTAQPVIQAARAVQYELASVDWSRLVTLDFETYYDDQYTLSKLNTSSYIRDPRFKAQMVGIKIGNKKAKYYTGARLEPALRAINWSTHALLCHNTQFDGFILSHHYGIVPSQYYDTLSMARGLHSNEIGAGLDEVSIYYGGQGKIEGALEQTKGQLVWPAKLIKTTGEYCINDVEECYRVFCEMVQIYPAHELELIDMTIRMFCDPVLRVDVERVKAEHAREIEYRTQALIAAVPDVDEYDRWETDAKGKRVYHGVLEKKDGRDTLEGDERKVAVAKKVLGSNEKFVKLLIQSGVPEDKIPVKLSPAWMKLGKEEREAKVEQKWAYAFSKTDLEFIDLPDKVWSLHPERSPNKAKDVLAMALLEDTLRGLVKARLAVKSTTNITRAARFIEAGSNGWRLPAGYSYYRAHTGRWSGNNKMNMQNLTRGGELRLSIYADKGHVLVVCDSGQIEARVNAWLWDQTDLLDTFRASDAYNLRNEDTPKDQRPPPTEAEKDAYCRYATQVYGRPITTADKDERQLGKICVLGLGFKMGAPKLQMTLARGAMGAPRMNFPLKEVQNMVNVYRSMNDKIAAGWKICGQIIEEMALGVDGHHKCIRWGGDGEGNGWVQLPNGMHLKYPDLKQERNNETGYMEWSYLSGEIRKRIYDGLLCENLVQALARIIVAEQMRQTNKKYRIVMTTHDEGVSHVKKAQGQKAFEFMRKCFTTPPDWCPDIPLWAEGGFAENYSK